MTVADRVEQPVDRWHERPLAHAVCVDEVDPELQADQVGGPVADRAGGELVEVALPGEPEAVEVDVGGPCDDRRPRAGRVLGLHAVTDRTAVVHPTATLGQWWLLDRCAVVDAKFAQHRRRVLCQPDLDVLTTCGEPAEANHARVDVDHLELHRGAVREADQVGVGQHLAGDHLTVDDEVDGGRVRCDAGVLEPGEHRLQLDGGRVGDELEPTARRHRRHEPDRRVDQLIASPRRQTLGERPTFQSV